VTEGTSVIEAVAIDGPGASGKTTVGAKVAGRLGFRFLDTGLTYRAATWAALRHGVDLENEEALSGMTRSLDIRITGDSRVLVDSVDATDELHTSDVDRTVSRVSAVGGVREALVSIQRRAAEDGPIVMVGRDICTVVLPEARTKVYLDASPEVRASRRRAEIVRSGGSIELEQVSDDLRRRDTYDSGREESPLMVSEDSVVIDTSEMSVDEVVERIVRLVRGN
jgi:cytidylate kinase